MRAVWQFSAVGIDNADGMVGQRLAAGHDAPCMRIAFCGYASDAHVGKRGALHAVNQRSAPERGKGQSDRGFSQSIDWRHGIWIKAARGEARGEMRDGLWTDWLGAVVGQTPAAQI